ncbi:alpha/beta fold hydrolase [Solimonas terrae]|uniref:Alpha/beta fold hydrolase n=1 Tax=Solimonas terrae TaxID=1396819 RepID=A0A6M2BU76_9GAMM|nr:alpha/beta fold hydrolase [Solimonas terrae]NGY06232.1 alpha/beta fold hydrolase [Solimonas terrae]
MDRIATRSVEANGLRFNVAVAGDGPTVLLLHGFPDTLRVWHRQIGVLAAAGYRVIAPDQRGCGNSEMPTSVRAYRLENLANDIIALLDALGIHEPVHLVGHDWGAVVGWQLAIEHAARFRSFAVMSVGHPAEYRRGFEQKWRSWYIYLFLLRGLAERLIRAGNWRAMRTLVDDPGENEARVAALSRPGRLTAGLSWYRANVWQVLTRRFGTTPLPVFGMWSDGDFALAENQMRNSGRHVTGPWRYQRIEGASHWLQIDRADDINRLLLAWFAAPSDGFPA